jgi:hypothetical protein
MPRSFRTILHGTCLLAGQHPPGSRYAAECPVVRAQKRGAKPRNRAGNTTTAGPPKASSENTDESRGCEDSFAPLAVAQHRRRRSGRPATGTSRWARRRRRLARA